MKKMRKRALSLLLCFATLSGTILPAVHALAPFARAEEVKTSWDNGDMIEKGLCTDSGKYNFYGADTPFSYAFYYEGGGYEYGDYPNYYGEPDDRAPGFYPMTKGENAEDGWTYGFYHCGKDSTESKDFLRVRAVQQAAANAPFEKYSPGVVFTAPYSGMVEFVYQYAGAGGIDSNHTFYVMRESANGYEDAEQQYKATQIANFGGGGACDSATFHLNVTEGEKIYFVTDNAADKGMSAHWVKYAEYVIDYTLETDKTEYEAGEDIAVTASAPPGGFGSSDTIKIIGADDSVKMEEAAAGTVTFAPTAGQLPAGSYKVALYHGETGVKSVDITVKAPVEPDPEVGYGNLTDRCGDENAKNRNFYPVDAPIGYAFYYQGTDPVDTRAAGFYDMVLANNGDGWSNGFYNCALNAGETAGPARVSSIHQASSCAPSFHYSPGFAYTAPETGMVEFVYQYAWLDGPPADANKMTFYIMRESATGYGDALYAYKPQKSVSGSNGSGTYDEATIKLNVTQGEKVYFVADNADNGSMVAHWIKSAAYVADPTYTLETDKVSYTAGEDVTVTADVSAGGFSARDTIRLSKGSTMIEEKAAAAEVTFSNLSAGNYQVALIRGGNAVQTKNITVVPDPNTTSWDNGGIMAHYKDSHSFYIEGTPFGYAFYYEGTDPQDSRAKGFYPMIISENNDGWSHGYYNCAVNSGETGLSRVSTIHQAAANAPSWHYSPGMVFTAPKTGTVEFTYQFAKAYGGGGCDNHVVRVLRDVTDPYENGAIATYPLTATLYGEGEGASGTPETQTITVNVTQGEKIYFVIDNHDGNGGMSAHWIKSARYLDTTPTYTVSTNQDSYTEGDTITVTSTVSEGGFSATDKIQILNAGSSVAMEKAAAETVTFDPTAEQLPAGDYQVALIHGGVAVATAEITVTAATIDPEVGYGNLTDRCGDENAKNRNFYPVDAPIGYAFYYQGTDPDDTRAAGFYDMVLANNGDGWSNGFYNCALNAGETAGPARVSSIHQASSCAPSFHYSPGFVYTAPETGMVEFVYQYTWLDGPPADANKMTFYIMRESATGYGDALYAYKPQKSVSGSNGSGTYDEATIKLNVTQGEKVYFVADNADNGSMVAHWIKSAAYVADPTYTLETDKVSYTAGEDVTVTADVSAGGFSARDTIRLSKGSTMIEEKAAAAEVTFSNLSAGNYQVALIRGGNAVQTKNITVVPDPNTTSWDNGGIMAHYKDSHSFYIEGTPFGYAFYYEGTDPQDSREKGFYPMIISENNDGWSHGYYNCAVNSGETGLSRVSTIHQAAANAPSWHYSPGMVFTAPKTGTVEFTYQFAEAYGGGGCDNHVVRVLRDVTDPYENGAIATYPLTATLYGEGEGASGTPETQTITVNVTQGEKIYFVIDNHDGNGGMSAHWIKSARYLDTTPTYTVSTNQDSYTEGDTITVTSTVSEGGFSATDKIQILNAGSSVAMEKAAAETVTFDPTAEQLPAGDYQVTLVHGGLAVATKEITVVAVVVPGPATSWNNGSMLEGGRLKTDAGKHQFLTEPFGYAFFYEGTDPDDTRLYGFHDMVLSSAGDQDWPKGFYACSPDVNSGTENQLKAIHQAAAAASTYHYSPGIVFTAPYTGTVKFVYQYAGLDGIAKDENNESKFTFYVMRDSAASYREAIGTYTPAKVASSDPNVESGGECTEVELTIPMTKGEKIYFVVDQEISAGGGMVAHWIKSAGYLSVDPTYILETDKSAYNENEVITITTAVFEGKFSAEDVIRIVPMNQDLAVAEFAVSDLVTVTATPEQVPAGNYRVVLIHNGKEVAAKEIRVVGEGLPTESRWDNGDLPMRCTDAGKRVFYSEDTPFGYAFFYEGTDPEDPRTAGFYDMILAEAGDQDWPKGFYACGLTSGETKDGLIDNRLNTLHQAAANAPTYHYSPGVVFTAPYDGTVRFVYQYAGLDGVEDKFTFYVMRDSAKFYEDALYAYKPAKAVSSADGSGEYDEVTIEIGVLKGQKIYFVTDSTANGHMCAHWIKSAEYVSFEIPDIQAPTTVRPKPADSGSGTPGQRGPVTVFDGTAWESGDLLAHYKDTHSFYDAEGTPFGYAFYYEGTDPEDNRAKGFYTMQMSANQDGWSDGYYNCAMTPEETGFARVSTIHQAAANAPSFHYSPGFVFTAPATGVVEFTYQFAKAYGGGGCDGHIIYVLRDVEDPYDNGVITTFRPTAVISGEGAEAAGTPETQVFTVAVTEGEKIYFVIDNHDANGGMSAHWIKTAKYVSDEIPKEDDDLGDPEPPLSETPDSADTNNDPTDNNKTFPSIAIWGGIALIAAIIAVAIVFMKKKKTADGEKEESKTGLPR